jgi:UDP-glucose 4-epimerase
MVKRPTQSVLIIGGAGFIGRALTMRLLAEGRQAHVHVLAREAVPNPIKGAAYHVGSMAEREFVLPLLRICSTVVHVASGTTPGSSSRTPTAEVTSNIAPTLSLLEIARDCPPEHIVFLSSGGTLYAGTSGCADEDLPPRAHSYHGAGKIALEAFLRAFAWDAGCGLIMLRPSNVYGPGQETRRGFGFVRVALECALRGQTLEIWGDGSAVRDFLYIDDLVAAVVAALQAPPEVEVFNVAYGSGHALSDVLEIVRRVSGRPLDVSYRPGRRSDVRAVRLKVSRIGRKLGWHARVDLEEGLARTWGWLQER